jgi:hypothetical protein
MKKLAVLSVIILMITFLSSCISIPLPQTEKNPVVSSQSKDVRLPNPPEKPNIKSEVITVKNITYVAYTIQDALELNKYLIRNDAYKEELLRIIKDK